MTDAYIFLLTRGQFRFLKSGCFNFQLTLAENDTYTEVFYVDEADMGLNHRIGSSWMRCGEQTAIPTPGRNQKYYTAGALYAHTRQLLWVEHHRKTSALFVKLLECLRR